jgi:hypothetical protein
MSDRSFNAPPSRRFVLAASATLIALYVALFIGGALSTRNGVMPTGDPAGQDFSNFYAASTFVRQGRSADVYPLASFNALLAQQHPGATATYVWHYTPVTSLAIAPLAYMPYGLAMMVWTLGGVALFCFAAYRLFPHRLTLLVALASPALFWDVWHHQLGSISAALLALGFYEASSRPLRSGAMIGAMILKPHLAIAGPFVLAAGRRWRAFAAAAATVLGLCALSVMILGPEPWRAFLETAGEARPQLEGAGQLKSLMPSIFVALQLLGAPLPVCWAAQGVTAVCAIALSSAVWWRSSSPSLRTAAALAACALISPYTFAYDTTITTLAIAAVAAANRSAAFHHPPYGWLTLAWFAPLPASGLAFVYGLQLGWLAPMTVLALVSAEVLPRRAPILVGASAT